MNIIIDDLIGTDNSLLEKMEEAALAAFELEEIEDNDIEISLSFVSSEEIKDINREYRGNDTVTDVLSFPQFEPDEPLEGIDEIFLGDVVICTDRAKEQAKEFGHSFEREMVYLFTHSIFHLLGYDHMEDEEKTVMRELEEKVMERIGLGR